MKRDVNCICGMCITCRKAKSKVLPHWLYTPLPVPSKPLVGISMDFVLGLRTTKRDRDSIFVVVNRFSKMSRFIPCHKIDDTTNIANFFFRGIVQLHGVPRSIVSNTQLLCTVLHKNLKIWEDCLSFKEFAYNRTLHTTTSYSPFEVVYDFNPLTHLTLILLFVDDRSSLDGHFQILDKINDISYLVDLPGMYHVFAIFIVTDLFPFDPGGDSRWTKS